MTNPRNALTRTSAPGAPRWSTGVIGLPRGLSDAELARTALVGHVPLSYGELTHRVDALAVRLRTATDGPGERIAIWLGKQPRYVEAILATLEAGCVYVPLDGGQPAGRVTTILGDAEPTVLFTDRARLRQLPTGSLPPSLRAIVLVDSPVAADDFPHADGGVGDADEVSGGAAVIAPPVDSDGAPVPVHGWAEFTARQAGGAVLPAARRAGPDDLAALLYTSGSTGVPKGVKISHRNLANFAGWALEELDLGPSDVFSGHASFNFDLSTFDLFAALGARAALWVIPDALTKDVTALADGIRRYGVTVWYSVPSILHLLTVSGALAGSGTDSLRYVVFAGEVFPIGQLRALAATLPKGTGLYNFYGPTETNVCTFHRVTPDDLERDAPLPIGAPIKGAHVWVEDEKGNPVKAPGEIGELVVAGECVTPGYWGREHEPAATDHRRGHHRTGDLVSHADGRLRYRGRKDRMVKLSGYRVELGEIEAAVLRHPSIKDAAVTVTGSSASTAGTGTDGGGRTGIAVHYVLRPGAEQPGLLQLKRHCAQRLPPYMLPNSAVRLDALPRNANGKTDYRALADAAETPPA